MTERQATAPVCRDKLAQPVACHALKIAMVDARTFFKYGLGALASLTLANCYVLPGPNPQPADGDQTEMANLTLIIGLAGNANTAHTNVQARDMSGTAFTITSVAATVTSISMATASVNVCDTDQQTRVHPPVACAPHDVTVTGPFIFDLMQQISSPPLQPVQVPALTYTRFTEHFAPTMDTGEFNIDGTFSDNGNDVMFTFALQTNTTQTQTPAEPLVIDNNGFYTWHLSVDPNTWFTNLGVKACVDMLPKPSGTVTLNDLLTVCPDLDTQMQNNITASATMSTQ